MTAVNVVLQEALHKTWKSQLLRDVPLCVDRWLSLVSRLLITNIPHVFAFNVQLGILHKLLYRFLQERSGPVSTVRGDQNVFKPPKFGRFWEWLCFKHIQGGSPYTVL